MRSALLPVGVRARPWEEQGLHQIIKTGSGGGGVGGQDWGEIEGMAQISHISHFDPLESFPQCDFDDDAHPFCDWAQASGNGGHWTRGSKNRHMQGTGAFGGSLNGGEEIEDLPSQRITESSPSWGVGW